MVVVELVVRNVRKFLFTFKRNDTEDTTMDTTGGGELVRDERRRELPNNEYHTPG